MGELSGLRNTLGKTSRDTRWDPHAVLQVCTCSGNDSCHHSTFPTDRHTVRQTHRQTDRQLLTGHTISSASGTNKTVNMLYL